MIAEVMIHISMSKNGHHILTSHLSALYFFSPLYSVLLGECRNLQELNMSECVNVTVSKTYLRLIIIMCRRQILNLYVTCTTLLFTLF